jgi:hypothetical protein
MTERLSRSISQSPPWGDAAIRRGDLFDKRPQLTDVWARCAETSEPLGAVDTEWGVADRDFR